MTASVQAGHSACVSCLLRQLADQGTVACILDCASSADVHMRLELCKSDIAGRIGVQHTMKGIPHLITEEFCLQSSMHLHHMHLRC